MCIFQQANTTYATDFATRWWTYVAGFEAACTGSSFASDECSANQQRLAGLDPAITNACMANSGGLGDNDDNTMLKKEMDLREVHVLCCAVLCCAVLVTHTNLTPKF